MAPPGDLSKAPASIFQAASTLIKLDIAIDSQPTAACVIP